VAHPDFVITLGLKREGNAWVSINEDYVEVVRLKLDEDNRPRLLEVRAEQLKDYLCARRMALRMSSYRERQAVFEAEPNFNWPKPDGFEITGLSETQKAGTAKKILMGSWHSRESASIKLRISRQA
jgi:hypothetical protein